MTALERPPERASWRKRLGWLLLLWALGVAALAAVAGALKVVMSLAGLTT